MSPEKQAALARLLELEQVLAEAEKALANWKDYDFRRTDGSTRQDQMHEEEGRERENAVYRARNAVDALKRQIEGMT